MKVKSVPEDFVVREMGEPETKEQGPFAIYVLEKTGIGTLEALHQVGREWNVRRERIGFAGLKDKWARTTQFVSIADGPGKSFEGRNFNLLFRGRSDGPVRRGSFSANAFEITLRDLSEGDVTHLHRGLDEIRRHGLPNYFDSQRFGSSRGTDDFIGRRLIRNDFEGALRLALATPTREDRGKVRRGKELVQKYWGRWEDAAKAIPAKVYPGRILRYLAKNPEDYAGAFERIDGGLRQIYVSAYQSYLWNETLKEILRETGVECFERRYAAGTLVFYRERPPELDELQIPYLKRNATLDGPRVRAAADKVLAAEGIRLDDLKLQGLRRTFFPGGARPALLLPGNLEGPEVSADERNPERQKGIFRMELPRGAYATLVIKRLFH